MNFQAYFKDSLCLKYLTNFDAKGAKRSVKKWTSNFYKSFFKRKFLYKNSRLSKIRLVHKYVMIWTVYYDWICIFENYEKGLTSLPSLVTKPMQDANLNGLFISAKSVYSLFSIFTEKAFFLIPWYSPPKWYNKLGFLGWNARHPLIL